MNAPIPLRPLVLLGATGFVMAGFVVAGCGAGHQSTRETASAPVMASAATVQDPGTATITSQGTGIVEGQPDRATVEISVSTSAPHAGDALARNNDLGSKVQVALVADGVGRSDLATSGLYLQQTEGGGYQANDTVQATIHDLGRAGTAIDDALAAAGDAGRLDGVQLSIADTDPAMAAARQQAVRAAQVQAQQMANAAGVPLGALVSLTDTTSAPDYPKGFFSAGAASGASAAAPSVPIQPGTQQVSVTVTGVWRVG